MHITRERQSPREQVHLLEEQVEGQWRCSRPARQKPNMKRKQGAKAPGGDGRTAQVTIIHARTVLCASTGIMNCSLYVTTRRTRRWSKLCFAALDDGDDSFDILLRNSSISTQEKHGRRLVDKRAQVQSRYPVNQCLFLFAVVSMRYEKLQNLFLLMQHSYSKFKRCRRLFLAVEHHFSLHVLWLQKEGSALCASAVLQAMF